MTNKKKPFKGILQKFIEPRGKNHLIKVFWTPQFAMLEKRTNINSLDKKELEGKSSTTNNETFNPETEIYKRCVTYEGLDHYSIQESINSVPLSNEIHRTCNSIQQHISTVANGSIKIIKMNL